MNIFVTGATGLIGSALVPELQQAGHRIVALARSASAAVQLAAVNTEAVMGSLQDLDILRREAARADAVVHLAFDHDFSKFKENSEIDKQAIETFGDALLGSRRRLVVSTGIPLNAESYPVSEDARLPAVSPTPRVSEATAMALRAKGLDVSVVRLPQVHNRFKQGLVTSLRAIAREKGVAAYVGSGTNCWSAAHALDVARLYRLAIESSDSLPIYHAVAEEGVQLKDIAEAMAYNLNLPVTSIAAEEATSHFGFFARLVVRNLSASSTVTQKHLGWNPTGSSLIGDLQHAAE